jgi:DNA-binding transcriptional LysR family regulator
LEEEIGTSLVDRHSRGVSLTAAGKRFLERASSVIEELRRAQEECDQLRGELKGRITVGLSPSAQVGLLAIAYPRFAREQPNVSVQIIESLFPKISSMLYDGSMDFYVGPCSDQLDRHLQIDLWWKSERIVVARKGHPLAGAKSLKDLVDCEWLTMGLREHYEDEFKEVFTAHGLPSPAHVTLVTSFFTALILLNSTDLLFILPRLCVKSFPFNESIVEIRVKETIGGPDIVLVRKSGSPLTPVAEVFSEHLLRAARGI